MLFQFNCDPQYYKNEALYETLSGIDFSELTKASLSVYPDNSFSLEVPDNEVRLLQTLINEDIVGRGMDNQNTVNETGKMLYWLYDEILYQKQE